jgi:uncharacterized YccA/Bax inhibitor family protein
MPNPVLNEKAFKQSIADARADESQAGFAAPVKGTYVPPMTDGPTTPWRPASAETMTVSGAISASLVLFALLLAGGVFGWTSVDTATRGGQIVIPGWFFGAVIGALVLALVTSFKPKFARFTSPVYAVTEGIALGVISKIYDVQWKGIASAAALGTACVFAVMLVLYRTRIIKVTQRFRSMVMGATMGVFLLYIVGALVHLFGGSVGFIDGASGLSILVSIVIVGVAAFNLMLDFDMIERGAAAGAPKYMEWYAAFGLLVTVVWLYLEILRLMAKLRER